MPNPLFRNFQARKKAAAKAAKAQARLASKSRPARQLRSASKQASVAIDRLITVGMKQLGKVGALLNILLKSTNASPQETLDVINRAVQDAGKVIPSSPVKQPDPPPSHPTRRKPPEVSFSEYPRTAPADGVEVTVSGRRRVYDFDDPVVSGEMIPVESSNVHSIGFDFNYNNTSQGTLKVRFLQGPANNKTAGPLYHYERVHPDLFEQFKTAISKGKFVWDKLRIRGTVSGRQYHYKLAGINRGYVPRQAKRYGQNEYFIQRRFKGHNPRTGEIREFTSELPDRMVNRGLPQRGVPNRGTPGRRS